MRKDNTNNMIAYAKAMTDEEIKTAAEYYGSMKWTPWVRVVETDMAPKMRLVFGMFFPLPGNEKEPLAHRIVEGPEHPDATLDLRDPRSGFVAYVPTGSLKKGKALVTAGGEGKTTACATCHGADLQGLGPVPGIAGRTASYMARQLYDMKVGARNGIWTQLMKPVVAKLDNDDILAIAAYLASLDVAGTVRCARTGGEVRPLLLSIRPFIRLIGACPHLYGSKRQDVTPKCDEVRIERDGHIQGVRRRCIVVGKSR